MNPSLEVVTEDITLNVDIDPEEEMADCVGDAKSFWNHTMCNEIDPGPPEEVKQTVVGGLSLAKLMLSWKNLEEDYIQHCIKNNKIGKQS